MSRPPLMALLPLLWVSLGAASAGAGDLDAVMSLLAAHRHARVDFVEQHFLAVLKRPVESFGIMTYDAPGRLEKRTVEPRIESLVLDGGTLTIERGGHTRTVDLASHPQILPFVESLRATLAGDRAALERAFRVEFAGTVARWTLTLTPDDPGIAHTVARVRIEGSRDDLLTVEILEVDGDRSLMTLRDHQGS